MFDSKTFISIALATLSCLSCQNKAAAYDSRPKQTIAQNFKQTNKIGIVGMRLNQNAKGETIVVEVKQNSPCDLAGVKTGDKLISIDDKSAYGRQLGTIYNLIKGNAGEQVKLSFYSPKSGQYTKTLKRVSPFSASNKSKTSISSSTPNHIAGKLKWLNYTSPSGSFFLKVPDAWEVKVDKNSGLINVFSYDAESVKIYPFFLPKAKVSSSQAKSLFNALIKSQASDHKWSNIENVGAHGLKATYSDHATKQVICLIFKNTNIGTAGRLFIARAPVGYSRHYSEIFSTILSSLRFRPTANRNAAGSNTKQASVPVIAFKKFQDPKQGSFTIDVPAGWSTQGATEQPNSLDYRTWVRTISPDQSVVVFMGDGSLPIYTIPSFQLASLGFLPGSRYSPGGYTSIIAPYSPANKFVREYGFKSLKKVKMQNIQLVSSENQPKLAREWNAQYSGLTDFGATSCRFAANNQAGDPVVGFFVGSTRRTKDLWNVTYIGGVVCGAPKEQLGMNVFVRMFKSFKFNPNWKSGQVRNIGQSYQQVTNFYTRFNQIQRQNYEARNRAREAWMKQASASLRDTSRSSNTYSNHDEWMRQATNNIRDTEDVVDPNTGQSYNIWSGSDYNYLHSDGSTILSTNTPIYPDVNWTQLTTLP